MSSHMGGPLIKSEILVKSHINSSNEISGSSPAPAIFCLPAVHDANGTAPAAAIAAPRLSKENLEIPAPPPPPRLGKRLNVL